MWATILTVMTTLLPFLAKLINYIIDKKGENDELKEAMLKLIVLMEKENIPVKMHERYQEQLDRLRKQLEAENKNVQ